ncbi:MAG: hypothetical protein KA104_01505 [Candidatus Pacebacteria bacterium]|nr:hypothetical protein [Candidatus Paceibacterota bacterium]
MASVIHHIDRLKEKPSHVRERVALGVSGGVTAIVALGWLTAMSSSGAFSLATKSVAEGVRPPAEVATSINESSSSFKSLLGAAAASLGASTSPAAISVVEVRSSSTLDSGSKNEPTVIPF